jgi:DNA polymerase-1
MKLFFDLETYLIDRGNLAPRPVAAAWSIDGEPARIGLVRDFLPVVDEAMRTGALFVGQNVAYDMACLAHFVPAERIFDHYRAGLVEDVMLREKLLRYATRGEADAAYGLDDLCSFYSLPVVHKDDYWRMNFWRLENVPVENWPAGAVEYLLADADRPAKIFERQAALDAAWRARAGSPILHLGPEEAYKAFALHLVACKGMLTDRERTLELKRVLEQALDATRAVLVEAGLVRANGSRDTKAAAAYVTRVCGELGMPVAMTKPSKKFPDGQVALGKDVLEGIPDDLLTAYAIYSQASSYTARVEDMCQGFELPLQVRFNTMLETRRTSTSKPRAPLVGVQAQNFPRALLVGRGDKSPKHPRGEPIYAPIGARECLSPGDDVFIQADLPTAELRSVSNICIDWFGASALADAINAGKDVHHILGGEIAGIPYEEMIRRAKEPEIKKKRDQAKPANFGFWGGMGAPSFRSYAWKGYRIKFTPEEAEDIRERWKRTWPEHRLYFDRASRTAKSGRVARLPDGEGGWYEKEVAALKHPYSGYWRGNCGFTQLCNSPFQELTGAAAARALCEVQRQCFAVPSSDLYGCWVVAYTHDEIVGVAPREQAHEAATQLGRVMLEKFNELHQHVPIKTMDPVVAEIYSKAMEPVRDASGRLAPWKPKSTHA